MKLSNTAIRAALEDGSLVIKPTPRPEDISVTTVDCKLGPVIYVIDEQTARTSGLFFDCEEMSIQDFWERHGRKIDMRKNNCGANKHGYWLRPGEVCLAMTEEHFSLPTDGKQVLQGTIWSRSRTARSFIRVHVDAPEVKPGTNNHVTLEIKNEGPMHVRLFHGMPIAQMSFEEVKGEIAPFESTFHGQKHASGAHKCPNECGSRRRPAKREAAGKK